MTRVKSEPEHLDNVQRGGGGTAAGGRRKQSKPIRVFMDIDGDTPVPATAAEDIVDSMRDSAARAEDDDDLDMEVESALPIQDTFPSEEESQHSNNDNNSSSTNIDSFPTKYHQLGSVFQESSMGLPARPNSLSNDQTDAAAGVSDRNIDRNSDSGNSDGKSRIFHQDAYCDLCDREFCNKYFLKTHRANMHGMFDDDGDALLPMSLGMPMPMMPMGMSLPLQMPPSFNCIGAGLQKQPSYDKSPPTTASTSPLSLSQQLEVSKPVTLAAALQQQAMPMLSSISAPRPISSAPLPQKSLPVTPPKMTTTPTKPSAPKPGHDMEDYCEICQKHFCNKYYLKKHKQDVHGIAPEPSPASAGKRGRPPMSAQMGNPPISMPSSLSASLNSLIMPPIMSSASMAGPQAGIPGLGNVMLLNPFAPPMLLQGLQQPPVLPPGFTTQGMNLPQLHPPITSSSNIESPKSSGVTPNTASMSGDALAALNAEAYCEICRKEFCNKYFLRVHKATKHGIFLDEDMMPTTGAQCGLPVLSNDLPPGTINITPKDPDTIHKTKDDRDDDMRSMKDADHHGSPEQIEECHMCQKQFVNKYNLKVHMLNAHGMTIPDFDLSPPRDNKSRSDWQQPPMQSTMFGNMIAAKLADRVMCDICNKEVCNKYFLKTHKIKVHGVDPAKAEAETYSSPQKKTLSVMTSMMKPPADIKPPMMNIDPPHVLAKPPSMKVFESNASSNGADQHAARPKDDELLRMGIDPEAYCELCKKEFCSKYFLKTHKQNIHGIKMDGLLTPAGMPYMKMDPATSDALNGLHMMARPDFGVMAMAALSRGEPLFPLNLMNNNNKVHATTSGNTSPSSQADSDASGPWKWRDSPSASQSVTCDLCNKEVCNKYFLRSHLLNKHGLNWDLMGPQSSARPALPFGLPPHLAAMERGGPMDLPMHLMPHALLPRMPDDVLPLDLKKSPTDSKKESKDGATDRAPAWHLPPKTKPAPSPSSVGIKKCEICSVLFPDKVTLQLHMIQDHPEEVVVSAKSKMIEERKFNGSNIGLSLRKKYQKSRRIRGHFRRLFSGAGITNGVKSALSSFRSQQKKKYRCAYCKDRFASRAECQGHIRNSHPSAKSKHKATTYSCNNIHTSQVSEEQRSPSNKENAHPANTSSHIADDKMMDTSVSHASPLPNGVDNNRELVMQSFYLEGQGSFAPAKLLLPVYQTVNEPTSVTFTLKPSSSESQ